MMCPFSRARSHRFVHAVGVCRACALSLGAAGASASAYASAAPAKPAASKPAPKPAVEADQQTRAVIGGRPRAFGSFHGLVRAIPGGSGSSQVCYILSQPKDVQPKEHEARRHLFPDLFLAGKEGRDEPASCPVIRIRTMTRPRVTIGAR